MTKFVGTMVTMVVVTTMVSVAIVRCQSTKPTSAHITSTTEKSGSNLAVLLPLVIVGAVLLAGCLAFLIYRCNVVEVPMWTVQYVITPEYQATRNKLKQEKSAVAVPSPAKTANVQVKSDNVIKDKESDKSKQNDNKEDQQPKEDEKPTAAGDSERTAVSVDTKAKKSKKGSNNRNKQSDRLKSNKQSDRQKTNKQSDRQKTNKQSDRQKSKAVKKEEIAKTPTASNRSEEVKDNEPKEKEADSISKISNELDAEETTFGGKSEADNASRTSKRTTSTSRISVNVDDDQD